MEVTANVVCYRSKTLSNGEHPLMIRVCKDCKKKYKSLGISVNPAHWDFVKGKPKTNCPNSEYINKIIADKVKELTCEIVKLKSEDKDFTASTLIEQEPKRVKPRTVKEIFVSQMQRLVTDGRRNYMLSLKQVYNSLLMFNKHLDICFSDIDLPFLRRYETWLRKQGKAENTIGIHFRTLRMIYNIAIEENAVKPECYPFRKFKVARLHEETAKRSLSKEYVERVITYKPSNNLMKLPIAIFAFTYYCGGINFIDIAHLTQSNIIEDKLIYKRHNTGKLIRIPLQPQAMELIRRYHRKSSPYLFPILSPFHKTESEYPTLLTAGFRQLMAKRHRN